MAGSVLRNGFGYRLAWLFGLLKWCIPTGMATLLDEMLWRKDFDKLGYIPTGIATLLDEMAEGVGFEPTEGLHLRLISNQVHSTTLPPLQISARVDGEGWKYTEHRLF